jgi:lysine decarboxylase
MIRRILVLPTRSSAQTPILASLQKYLSEQVLPFHTPGHKLGKGAHANLQQLMGPSALSLDLTVVPGISDLFDKQGSVRQSQQQAAALYGADRSYFLVNGTTCGIYAMILATVGPGEKIIVPRNIHRSVMGGLILSGAIPIFVEAELDAELNIVMNTTAETYERAMELNPDAKAVLAINPTYYGAVTELGRIVDSAHRHEMTVLVDEAHGPHLHFSSLLPMQAITAGADLVVQSTHKILGALSQSSILHCRKQRVNQRRLESMLQLVQSSSPNYLLLVSLEAAVAQLLEAGQELVGRSVVLATQAREQINQIAGLYCFGQDRAGRPGIAGMDPTKLVVTVSGLGIRGNDAAAWLRRHGKVQAELADVNNVLFLVTLADDEATIGQLVRALSLLAEQYDGPLGSGQFPRLPWEHKPAAVLRSPRDAVFGPKQRIRFAESGGRICAETITSYPPGIPLLFPGEMITPEAIVYCQALLQQGFTILGPEDPALITVEVVA